MVPNERMKQWHRLQNVQLEFMVDLHANVKKRELKWMAEQVAALEELNTHEDPHQGQQRKFAEGKLRDKQQQTALSYNHENGQMMKKNYHGAWEFVSCCEDRV